MKRKSLTLEPAVRRSGRPNKGVHQEQGGRVPVEIAKQSASIACQKEHGEPVAASNVPVTKKQKNAPSAAAHADQGFRNPFDTCTAADLAGQTFRNTPKSVEQSVTQGGRLTVLNASLLTTIGSTSPNINLPSLDVPSTDQREQILSSPLKSRDHPSLSETGCMRAPPAKIPRNQFPHPVVQSSQHTSSQKRPLPFFPNPNLASTSLHQTSVLPNTPTTQKSAPSNRSLVTPSIRNFSPLSNPALFPSHLGQVTPLALGLPFRGGRSGSPRTSSQFSPSPFADVPAWNTTRIIQTTRDPFQIQSLHCRGGMKPTRTTMSTSSPASSIISNRRVNDSNPTHFSSGHASANRATEFSRPPTISKQLADKLVVLESTNEDMQVRLGKMEQKAGIIRCLQERNEELALEVGWLTTTVKILEASIQNQGEAIDELFKVVGERKAYNAGINDSNGEDDIPYHATKKRPCNNFFNNAVRKTMLIAMGLGSRARVKDVTKLASHANGGGFIKDREVKGRHFQATQIYPAFTKELLASKSNDDLLHRMESVFKTFRTAYLKKDWLADLDSEAEEDAEGDEETWKQRNCRWQRKSRVSEPYPIRDFLTCAAEAQSVDFKGAKWFFKAAYQSTDESDTTPVLDPNMDIEEADEIPAASTRKPWITVLF
ncbi:hypothetical protein BDZ94DRAFT_1308106 [Collybia nuda]|uniref:Uncharacterized protein n=1 Tax=Collybia nuda TaxID=64659 RepID=A0A9P5Y8V3_9AGAR|nr:hypothetical protein BDZ94DRAFT_1308106 [Collybia nuda]